METLVPMRKHKNSELQSYSSKIVSSNSFV